jgi:ABC-2 type transport system ATP-binding protein
VGDVVCAGSDDIDGMDTAIEVTGLTKRFREVRAVHDLTFSVRRGAVTGFLGPNGAGKTTTLKMVLGLAAPSGGSAQVLGRPYAQLDQPARRIGAVLESTGFHPGRRGRDHLRILATALELPDARVDAVLDEVGLTGAGNRRVKGYSLGMRQRLGLASALLGEPEVLILDEPANGLDPEGVQWLRRFLRAFAARGGTVLVSSHQLAEMAQTVDDVVIIAGGRLVLQSPLADLAREDGVRVRTPHPRRLISALAADGISADALDAEALVAFGTTSEAVGLAAAAADVVIYEMTAERFDLEELFLDLTSQGVKS